ncbi:DegV family protein [Peribacillus cavernae]|uniref:DegV family protein n=1 Tax=Peribacillus cavernae TaxID=1674310 RepID=A0A3S0U4R1_9BACI|nr:DegV family protein [Peribacillus cavernae]MDQ0217556.1 DegV family protein with EDD domain [Peribacillus cavernae]RUQ30009.1 DegV family protein [Peribacillus cavernae]
MTVQIIADSACDLPLSFYKENNVSFMPLQVLLDGKNYEDLQTIDPKEVYSAMREGKAPKTSQVSPEYFLELFTKLAQQNQQAIYIAFSSELSGTYQTAVMARNQVKEEYPTSDIEVIDSKCASLGYGLVVVKAAELATTGASKQSILEDIAFRAVHMEHLFTVDNLEYLARGGRISKASAFVGGLLNIKPLLHVEDGKLIPIEKIRGKKKLLKRVIELMHERGVHVKNQTLAISHGDDEETALEWKQAIQDEFGVTNFVINTIGSAIGAHVGPGTMSVYFLNELPPNE